LDNPAEQLDRAPVRSLVVILDAYHTATREQRCLDPHVVRSVGAGTTRGVTDLDVAGRREDAQNVYSVQVLAGSSHDLIVGVAVQRAGARLILVNQVAGYAGSLFWDYRQLREGGNG